MLKRSEREQNPEAAHHFAGTEGCGKREACVDDHQRHARQPIDPSDAKKLLVAKRFLNLLFVQVGVSLIEFTQLGGQVEVAPE